MNQLEMIEDQMLCIESPMEMEPNIGYRYINGGRRRDSGGKKTSSNSLNTGRQYNVQIGRCKMQSRQMRMLSACTKKRHRANKRGMALDDNMVQSNDL